MPARSMRSPRSPTSRAGCATPDGAVREWESSDSPSLSIGSPRRGTPGSPVRRSASRGLAASGVAVREAELVARDLEHIALVDPLVVDPHPLVDDAQGRSEILEVVLAVSRDHRSVLGRHVAAIEHEIADLRVVSDHERLAVHRVALAGADDVQRVLRWPAGHELPVLFADLAGQRLGELAPAQ